MGHKGHALGILSPESPKDLRDQVFVGVSAEVAVKAWNKMEELDLLPPSSQFQHYLWALTFLCTYPPNNSVEYNDETLTVTPVNTFLDLSRH
jgi:hypothetical protein